MKGMVLPKNPQPWYMEPAIDQPLSQCLGFKQYQQETLRFFLLLPLLLSPPPPPPSSEILFIYF